MICLKRPPTAKILLFPFFLFIFFLWRGEVHIPNTAPFSEEKKPRFQYHSLTPPPPPHQPLKNAGGNRQAIVLTSYIS